MERLTDRSKEIPMPNPDNAQFWARVHEKLARYEDAEESGLLVQLPVAVGSTVYWIPDLSGDTIRIDKVAAICIYKNNRFRLVLPGIDIEPIFPNAHLFLTREEAESAIKRAAP